METVNNRLKIIREELGYNQTDFAYSLDIKQSYLSVIERGRKEVTLKLCTRLKEKFHVSIDWLLSGDGNKILSNEQPVVQNGNFEVIYNANLLKSYLENGDDWGFKLVRMPRLS